MEIAYTHAAKYNLAKENCRFVASIIQEGLTQKFEGKLAGKEPTWNQYHAPKVKEIILREFLQQTPKHPA